MISKKELNLYLLNGYITPNWKLSSKQIFDLIEIKKDIIDDVWPQVKQKSKLKNKQKFKNETPNFQEVLYRLLKLFGI